ncbi:MAG: endonuclease III, partial [Chthoniobacterales bacterium]
MTLKERAACLAKRLPEVYPDAHCELNYKTPFELLVATILSAQCTDKRVNIVTKELFRQHKQPKDFVALSQEDLEKLIH